MGEGRGGGGEGREGREVVVNDRQVNSVGKQNLMTAKYDTQPRTNPNGMIVDSSDGSN